MMGRQKRPMLITAAFVSDRLPPLSMHNSRDRINAHTVLAGQCAETTVSSVSRVLCANCLYVSGRQFGDRRPSLTYHVSHVVRMGAKIQVVGADASGHRALMQHAKTIRDLSMMEFPRNTRGVGYPPFALTSSDQPIATRVQRTGPQPTTIGLSNLCPKPFLQRRTRTSTGSAGFATEASVRRGTRYPELFTAQLAAAEHWPGRVLSLTSTRLATVVLLRIRPPRRVLLTAKFASTCNWGELTPEHSAVVTAKAPSVRIAGNHKGGSTVLAGALHWGVKCVTLRLHGEDSFHRAMPQAAATVLRRFRAYYTTQPPASTTVLFNGRSVA